MVHNEQLDPRTRIRTPSRNPRTPSQNRQSRGGIMRTNMQTTSLDAFWNEIQPTLAPRLKEIIKIFRDNPGMTFTNRELLDEIRLYDPTREINQVTPRVNWLRGHGKKNPFAAYPLLIKSNERQCRITNRKVIAWQLNNR